MENENNIIVENVEPEIIVKKKGRPLGGKNKTHKPQVIRREKPGRPKGAMNKHHKYELDENGNDAYPRYDGHMREKIICPKCDAIVRKCSLISHSKSTKCSMASDSKKLKALIGNNLVV